MHLEQKRATYRNLSIIVGVGLLLSLPVLVFGFPFAADDTWAHTSWYASFVKQLYAGELYPRWLQSMNNGAGSPAFFFYPPVAYYLTAVFHPFFQNDAYGLAQLACAATLFLIASGVTCYFWLRDFCSETAATIGAILYIAAPYHLAIDLYTRAAFAEFCAFVWLPLLLLCVRRLETTKTLGIVALTFLYAVLIATHLPTTVIFSPLLLAYAAVCASSGTLKNIWRAGLGLAGGIGLAAIYMLPAISEQQHISVWHLHYQHANFTNHFLLVSVKLWGGIADRISIYLISIIGLSGCAIAVLYVTGKLRERENLFWIIAFGGSVFLMTDQSKSFWFALELLRKLQFPWRINTLALLAFVALITATITVAKPINKKVIALSVALMLVWIPMTLWAMIYAYPAIAPETTLKEKVRQQTMTREALQWRKDAREYAPRGTVIYDAEDIERYTSPFERDPHNPHSKARVITGQATMRVDEWQPRFLKLEVEAATESIIELRQLYFPYWQVRTVNDSAYYQHQLVAAPLSGFIRFTVPRGVTAIEFRLTESKSERTGRLISTLTFLLLCGVLIFHFIRTPRNRR